MQVRSKFSCGLEYNLCVFKEIYNIHNFLLFIIAAIIIILTFTKIISVKGNVSAKGTSDSMQRQSQLYTRKYMYAYI